MARQRPKQAQRTRPRHPRADVPPEAVGIAIRRKPREAGYGMRGAPRSDAEKATVLIDRLKAAERAMATHLSGFQAEVALAEDLNVNRRTARKYLKAMRRIWALESRTESRAGKREALRAAFRLVYERALERNQMLAALRALERIGDLDGWRDPDVSAQPRVLVQAASGATVNLLELTEQARQIKAKRAGFLLVKGADDDEQGGRVHPPGQLHDGMVIEGPDGQGGGHLSGQGGPEEGGDGSAHDGGEEVPGEEA